MKLWTIEGATLHTWKDFWYIDVASNRQNNLVCIQISSNKIKIIDLDSKEIVKSLDEDDKIRSISMSRDGKFLLVNCSEVNPVINLWSIEHEKIIQKFTGHKQSKYVLK
mmetsp:Transcript_39914/g.45802  ORF Transcript_39914/g.45802 Transcript_39914/m.45802 type:complete len:109 (-) Transcript_39914:406-732(-)